MGKLSFFVFIFTLTFNVVASMPKGVNWYTGDVNKAFQAAEKQHKPLFLYWGAVWCPPCNQMKKSFFSTPEFQALMKDYIPVYLDGDSNEAQVWGEKLSTRGYPTMIVMNEKAHEVFRMPLGVTPAEYMGILKNLLKGMKDVKELVNSPREKLTEGEWSILAAHSWSQDDVTSTDKESLMKDLFEQVPSQYAVAKSRFFFYWMEIGSDNVKEEQKPALKKYFLDLIKDDQLILANATYISMYSKGLIDLLLNEEEKKLVRPAFIANLWKLYETSTMTLDDRLSLLEPAIKLEVDEKKELSKETAEKVTKIAVDTAKKAKGEFERLALVDRCITLLQTIGNIEAAKKMAEAEVKVAKSPYYFMSALAQIAKSEKKNAEAISWARKAWNNAKGKNTRFRWGVSYTNYLFDLDSDNVTTIKTDVMKILKEATKDHEAFVGANKLRFDRLATKLNSWSEKHGKDSGELKNMIAQLCLKAKDKKNCEEWSRTLK